MDPRFVTARRFLLFSVAEKAVERTVGVWMVYITQTWWFTSVRIGGLVHPSGNWTKPTYLWLGEKTHWLTRGGWTSKSIQMWLTNVHMAFDISNPNWWHGVVDQPEFNWTHPVCSDFPPSIFLFAISKDILLYRECTTCRSRQIRVQPNTRCSPWRSHLRLKAAVRRLMYEEVQYKTRLCRKNVGWC